jgi:integrase
MITLSAMMSAAVDDDDCAVTVNPASRLVKRFQGRHDPNRQRLSKDKYFTREEVGILLGVAREHYAEWFPFFLCGFRTGMRMGELLALQWGDIDWRKSFIHVQRAWVRKDWTTPKSGVDREIDMSARLRVELRLWRRRQSAWWLARGMTRPDLVFPSNAYTTPHDDSKVRKIFMSILKRAELRHRNLHAMRHTFISLLLQQGESPAYVQKQAGHKSMDLTINTYGHFLPGGNRAAVDRLDDTGPSRTLTSPVTPRVINLAAS